VDPLTGFFALTITMFSNFPLVSKLLKDEDVFTKLVISFVFGLFTILLPLYIVGILLDQGIVAISWVIFLSSITFFSLNAIKFVLKVPKYIGKLKNVLKDASRSPIDWVFVVAIVFFIFKYFYILSIKGIFDYDALSLYLPFGRRIYEADSIPLTGYDYQPVIRPVGISVLYAWMHSLSGSAYDENFRLFPILFVVVTILILYTLGVDFWSKKIAKIAIIVYTMLPLHDAVLFYASYYPDLLYNTLILATFFFMYKYLMKKSTKYCLLGGISFGLSLLMKLQAAYFLQAMLFIFAGFLENKRLRITATYLSSLFTGFLFIFFIWPDLSFFWSLPITSQILAFFVILSATTLVVIAKEDCVKTLQMKSYALLRVFKDALIFGITASIAVVWFLRNYFRTGSWVWIIGIGIPNYQWALDFLSQTQKPIPLVNIGMYIFSLVLIPFTVYVLGMWIIPILIGMLRGVKIQKRSLLMIIWMIGYWIGYFWSNFWHFELYYTIVNERDLYFFAPFFSLFAALGINHISRYFTKNHDETFTIYMLSSLGFISLTQSLLIFTYGPNLLRSTFNDVAKLFSCPLNALIWQLPRENMLSYTPNILYFIFSVNISILCIPLLGKLIIRIMKRHIIVNLNVNSHLKDCSRKIISIVLAFLLLVTPYIWLTYEFSGGNIQAFGENQLKPKYGGLFTEVTPYLENQVEDGDVILMTDYYPLQYYLHRNVRVITLNEPGNLAAFRSAIEGNNSMVVNTLGKLNVRYVLLMKGRTQFTEYLSNNSRILDVVRDPRYFQLFSFQNWNLYESIQGTKSVIIGWKDDLFTSNWNYIESYSTKNARWSFTSEGDVLTVTVAGNATVSFRYLGLPLLQTTEYQYIACRVRGSSNARWLFRLFSQDGSLSYDFPYWWKPSGNWETYLFRIDQTPLKDQLLDKQAFLDIKSVDSSPATLYVNFYMIFRYEPT